MSLDRAWAVLECKSLNEEERIIEGLATCATCDRAGDIVEPGGAQFSLPLPLLWQHSQREPIGEVFAASITPGGLLIKARIAKVNEPGVLKDHLDFAWQSIKAKLVRGLSIGFKPLEVKPLNGRGHHILKWLWAELSAVTIPSHQSATILSVKTAAHGHHQSGASDPLHRRAAMTIQEQITQFENSRAAKAARMSALMEAASATGSTLDEAQETEYDGLDVEVKSIDAHLVRLNALLASQTRTPITGVTDPATGAQRRAGVITVTPNVPKGTAFVRYAQALLATKGSRMEAIEYAKRWHDSTPEVELCLKAAVAAGTTLDATWAAPLAAVTPLASEFLELLRPATVIGKIPGLRKVPFNVSIAAQTGGGTYGWVGQGAVKPVGKLAFSAQTLGIAKAAGIIVISEELARVSTPSAEETIREDMIAGIAAFLDVQFTDPAVAAVANVSPASITNGVTGITSAGTTAANARTDLQALIAALVTAGLTTANAVLLMSETNALALGSALNALGQPLFPGLGVRGGQALGITVITSQALDDRVILLDARSILLADDGGVDIDVSREASVQMNTTPTDPPDATVVLTSLWQNNLIGLRCHRFINWKRARTGSVQFVEQTYAA